MGGPNQSAISIIQLQIKKTDWWLHSTGISESTTVVLVLSHKAYCILFPPFRDAHFLYFLFFFSFVLSPVFFHTCDLYVRSLSVSLFNYGFDRYSWQFVSRIFSSLKKGELVLRGLKKGERDMIKVRKV